MGPTLSISPTLAGDRPTLPQSRPSQSYAGSSIVQVVLVCDFDLSPRLREETRRQKKQERVSETQTRLLSTGHTFASG